MTAGPATDACQFLFVYGTLMGGLDCAMGREQRVHLAGSARSFGAGIVQGRLYDLGHYPGLVTSDDPGEQVAGEVLRLTDAAATLGWLDAYEGIGAAGGDGVTAQADEYVRILMPVRLEGGTLVSAWVYLYRGDVAGKRHLANGRWLPATIG